MKMNYTYRDLSMSLLGLGVGRGFARSTFLLQSFGGDVVLVLAPVLLQLFFTGSVPSKPFFSALGASHFFAGTVLAFAVERGASPFGAGAGEGVEIVA